MSTIPTKKPKDMSTKKPLDVSKIPKFTSKYTNMALSHVKGEYVMIRVCRERSFCPGQGEILRLWRQWSGRRGRSSWRRRGGGCRRNLGRKKPHKMRRGGLRRKRAQVWMKRWPGKTAAWISWPAQFFSQKTKNCIFVVGKLQSSVCKPSKYS